MPLTPPPTDADGDVIPHDHQDIVAGDEIVRRISAEWVILDKGVSRLTSLAFRSSSRGKYPGLSVDLVRFAEEAGHNPRTFVTTPIHTASVVFLASALRAEGYKVGSEPVDGNPYHGEVWGAASRAAEKRLRTLASWYVPLAGVFI